MRKTQKPYTLIMGGMRSEFFKTLQQAKDFGVTFNNNRVRSSGGEAKPLPIKIYYEQAGENQQLVYEED